MNWGVTGRNQVPLREYPTEPQNINAHGAPAETLSPRFVPDNCSVFNHSAQLLRGVNVYSGAKRTTSRFFFGSRSSRSPQSTGTQWLRT